MRRASLHHSSVSSVSNSWVPKPRPMASGSRKAAMISHSRSQVMVTVPVPTMVSPSVITYIWPSLAISATVSGV